MYDFKNLTKTAGQKRVKLLNSLSEIDSFLDFYVNKLFRPHYSLFKCHKNIINFPRDINKLKNKFFK